MKNLILRTAIFIAVLTASLAAFAAPTIVISDGVTAVTNSVASGEVFATLIDQYWTVYNANGNNLGDPHNPALELDATPNDVAGGAPDLTITFSDNGFGPTPGRYFSVVDAHAFGGTGGKITFDTFYDLGNQVLALTSPLTTSPDLLPDGSGLYHYQTPGGSGASIIGSPFSLTEVLTISGLSKSDYSIGAELDSLSLACAGGTGQVGTPYSSALVASGGNTPYTFSIISGSLPPGLTLDTTTGAITGIPTVAGPSSYVAQVVDALGRMVDTSALNCGITISPCSGQIGDFVWYDANRNGCQDANEPGIPNVKVDLYSGACNSAGTFVATTLTDNTGHYLFSGLCPGDYQVAITTPAGYTATTPNVGCKDTSQPPLPPYTADRDSKCACGVASPCITCVTLTTANPVNLNVDCGYVCNGQIGDFVWNDLNANGCQDANEPGIPNVKVDLYSGTCGTTGAFITTTNTDSNGKYLFSGLCPGDYQVAITTPAGYAATTPNKGCTNPNLPPPNNQTDSKCNCGGTSPCITCVTLTADNLVNLNVDCGYTSTLHLSCAGNSGTVGVPYTTTLTVTPGCPPYTFSIISGSLPAGLTLDANSGIISGTPTTAGTTTYTAQVKDSCGNTATTSGQNCSIIIVCNGQIGDFVWYDANGNGCQDAGEPGIPGVQVRLYSGACGSPGTLIATKITDSTGHYLFSGLCPGAYQVAITTPAGYNATTANKGCTNPNLPLPNNQTDSKCNCGGASPCITCVTLTIASPVNLNVDCGYVKPPTANCVTITAVQGVAITPVTMVGSGGCGGPYTFSATGLPAGLVMSTGGTISGTPAVNGTFSYTVTVKDSCGNAGTINCSVTVKPPPCTATISGYIRCYCDLCVCKDQDHDDRDHDGRDHSKCNHKYNQCSLDGQNHAGCRHERGWCNHDGQNHSGCNHAKDVCKVDKRDHSWCRHQLNICIQDGHNHAECDHAHFICKEDGRDHSTCNHKYNECSLDGKDHTGCRHARGWCNRDGHDHSGCNHAGGICKVDTRDHSSCSHDRDICVYDGHDHSLCDHAHSGCRFGTSPWQCGLQGFTVQLKNSAGTFVLATQLTAINGFYSFANLAAGTYQVVVLPLANYSQTCDPDGVLDNKTTVTVTNCQVLTCADFCYKKVAPCYSTIAGFVYAVCGRCAHDDHGHDARDHDGCDHSKCNHKYNECGRDGQDHTGCRHERGWCNRDGNNHSYCNHAAGVCKVDTRSHSLCNHALNICVQDGFNHAECDHAHGICKHNGGDHSKCNHKYNECALDGKDHTGCRHERGWCNRDGHDHSKCDHARGYCAVDTRDHSACNHDRNICLQDGHNHAGCNHAQTGCWYGFAPVECGLQGFTVQLKNSAGTTVLATQITAANGSYAFANLSVGTYQVVVIPLANYVQTSDPDCVVDGKTTVKVASCKAVTCVNFTYQQPYVAFRSAACGYAASGVLKLTINKPAGTQPGDVMVASIGTRPSSVVNTAPAGWTLVRDLNNTIVSGNSSGLDVYYKVAGTSEPASYNWTFSTSAGSAGGIQSFSGVDALNPIDVEAGQNTPVTLSVTAPSVTTRYANDMVVTSHEIASLAGFTPPYGMTEAFDAMSGTVRGAVGVAVEGNYRLQKTVGATGTATATASNDADTGNADTLALKSK
jgi:protocatechuate 3,4-dioxygenase beta subunit